VRFAPLRFESYAAAASKPNVVVDGSPNESTVLTLTHWPGYPAPDGLAADLSAQMAFRYLDDGSSRHGDAEVVTNNHFDQDGVVGVYALHAPEDALRRRDLLEDLAAAGDFATYRDRRAARLSMVLAAYADPERSPVAPLPDDPDERGSTLYQEVLDRLPALIDELDHPGLRRIWEDEDRQLAESEAAIAAGDVAIEEDTELDLAVVTVPVKAASWSGHRFAHQRYDGIHPMAVHNVTDRGALLLVRGRRYELTYRYESWVQMRTRRPRARVDLRPLADQLSSSDVDAKWHADPPGALTPQLHTTNGAESRLAPADVVQHVGDYMRTAPPAWDPYAPS
jgi:uncharacterized protein DUF6687